MSNRLPPLTALRAFDAAARHMSFAQAAAELTDAGMALSKGAAEGFQTLATAWRAAQRTQDTQSLTVTAGPAFTAKWLAPRLYEFAQSHPEVELRFAASLTLTDLTRDNIDVAIRFSSSPSPDLYSLPLAEEWVMPVMTPALAAQYPTVESLQNAPLLFDESINFLKPPVGWSDWFGAMGAPYTPTHGPRFSQSDHAIDAALAGAGVVMGRRALVVKDLADGRLVAPFPTALATGTRFSFLCLKGAETRKQIAAFRDWIVDEIEKTAHITESLTILKVPRT